MSRLPIRVPDSRRVRVMTSAPDTLRQRNGIAALYPADSLLTGETVEQIIEAHPRLADEAVRAALAFAAEALRADVVYPTSGTKS